MLIKICQVCLVNTVPRGRVSNCSEECAKIVKKAKAKLREDRIKKEKEVIIIQCACCGIEVAKKGRSIYCSERCQRAMNRKRTIEQRKKEGKKESMGYNTRLRNNQGKYTVPKLSHYVREAMRSGYY